MTKLFENDLIEACFISTITQSLGVFATVLSLIFYIGIALLLLISGGILCGSALLDLLNTLFT